MTDEDLDRIERVLGLVLPLAYRDLMMHCSFDRGSAANDMLAVNADVVIQANRRPHDIIRGELPTRDYLWVGSDGSEVYYYIDLRNSSPPVYSFDLETGVLKVFADGLEEFTGRCSEIDREVEEDERRPRTKKWWQFWRRSGMTSL